MDLAKPAQKRDEKGRFSARSNTVAYWLKELEAAEKRQSKFVEDARKILELYEGEKQEDNAYNILYSNTEVLLPALYNASPTPIVNRRFKDEDPLALAVSQVTQRGLEYGIDTPDPNYTPFDDLITCAVTNALVPGWGITWVKYDADFEPLQDPERTAKIEDEGATNTDGDMQPDASLPVASPLQGGPSLEKVSYEAVCGEDVPFDRFRLGAGRKWSGIPWVARQHDMNYTSCLKAFGQKIVDQITFSMPDGGKGMAIKDCGEDERAQVQTFGQITVWEVWHKSTKKVVFISESLKDECLKELDDPLGLQGFFPCPEPLKFFARPSGMLPVPLYNKYKNQAQELNRITLRINRLISMLKVRGFYDEGMAGIKTLLESDDGTLLPAKMVAAFRDGATPQNSIWMMPLADLQAVLQGLYGQREQVKNVIYEITGISDILRGSTVASESATAQKLKQQYGTMRLRRMQNKVQVYVREVLRLMTEVMANKFSQDTWKRMTNLPYPTAEEQQAAQQRVTQLQQQAQQMQQQAQQNGQDPAQLQQDPAAQQGMQQMQELQKTLGMPSWDAILQLMKDKMLFEYKVDIETDSTIDAESSADKQAIQELLMAIAQVFQNTGPLVQEGLLPMGAVKGLLLTVTRRYRLGDELEQYLQQIPDQVPPKSDPAADAKKQEADGKMQLMQLDIQAKTKESQMKMAMMDKEQEIAQAKLDLERQELEMKREELQLKQMELGQKRELNDINHQGKVQAAHATTQAKMAQIALGQQAFEQKQAQAVQAAQQPLTGNA